MINYFKINSNRCDLGSVRLRGKDELETPEWKAEIQARAARIMKSPPARIDWEQFVFFNDSSAASIAEAWQEALVRAKGNTRRVHVARALAVKGAWVDVFEIGEPYPAPKPLMAS